jgi:trimeric autotransporter adhesin
VNFSRKLLRIATFVVVVIIAMPAFSTGRTTTSFPRSNSQRQSRRIHGLVRVGSGPVSGIKVIAVDALSGNRVVALSGSSGAYSLSIPPNRQYLIYAEIGLRTTVSKVVPAATSGPIRADFYFPSGLTATAEALPGTSDLSSLWPPLLLPPVTTNLLSLQPAPGNAGGNSGGQIPTFIGDPAFSGDAFAVNGQSQIIVPYFQMADQMRLDFEDGHQLQGPSEQPTQVSSSDNSSNSVNASVVSVNPNVNPIHGVAFWTGGNSALNANPHVLAGQPLANPSYYSNAYGLTVGGQPFIPGLIKPNPRDYLLLSYFGQSSTSLVNDYGIVPTELEREGNFSQFTGPGGAPILIYPPNGSVPYPNNTIDTSLNPAALALLRYLPEPNLQSEGLNYRLLTTQGTHINTFGVTYTHTFGDVSTSPPPTGVYEGPTQSFNLNFNLGDVATDVINIFPQLGGKQRTQGYFLNAGYTFGKGDWLANINGTSSRNNAQIRNLYTGREDVATEAGLNGPYNPSNDSYDPVNTNPLNYGLPNLVLNNYSSFNETQPNFQLTQVAGLSGSASWTHNSHILRFGGDLHRIEFNLFGSTDATGTYIFSGGYTQIEGAVTSNQVSETGSSFADFLLGLPQETKIESPDQKAYTRQTNWNVFARDDWRVRSNLTLLYGLRYDYFSPYVEIHNRLSTLDYNADFSEVQPVFPDGVGPVSGTAYPRSLIKPDRNNFAPHLGFAWEAAKDTVVRSGYGIYYGVGQYGTFIQNLAYQPPFAHVEANGNIPHDFTTATLEYGFGNFADDGNYAINKNYRLPYAQVWYLDIQQTLPLDFVLDVGYGGVKGTRLDVVSTPGVINTLPFANAYFDYEDSTAFSNFNSFVARVRREMQNGFALEATYAYSHSIDDASSTNAGIPVVAQNPNDLLAEESNSSFDIRHQVTGSFLYQLPLGPGESFLKQSDWLSNLLNHWSVAGYFTLASGVPLTPYVVASVAEVERGTHGSVRPDRIPGVSIPAGGGHLDHWFNTAAFSAQFAPNQLYGTASRYCIPGPGVENINLSLSKVIELKEAKSLEFRAMASNAFNIVQYAGVNTQISSSTFGYVNAVQQMRQLTFLARFKY